MKKSICFLSIVLFIGAISADASIIKKDANQKEAEYIQKVKKQEEKEKYKRRLLERVPSGYMTVDEYEEKSMAKDKAEEKVGIPKVEKGSDMKYVPQPTYKIVRYNNPPGSPEISLKGAFFQKHQQNAQGIVSPDFKMLVYPAIYYYSNSASTACDLFVIPLDEGETNLNRIMKANVIHRKPDPILSTEKSIDNDKTFRTLTPVDFSADSTKLLVKEKIGNMTDGIWKTNAYVYDFVNKLSYNLVEVRDAIIYYWKENKGLDLDDKRWDIYPLGFDLSNQDRIIVNAYAYTGGKPVNLGIWSVDTKGQQSRLISFNNTDVPVSMNGMKIIQDGVVAPSMLKEEENQLKRIEKADDKQKKKADTAEEKELKDEYKSTIKEMDTEFKQRQQLYNAQQNVKGSTSMNETLEKLEEIKLKQEEKAQKLLEKQEAYEQKVNDKRQRTEEKQQALQEKLMQKSEQELETELERIKNLPLPSPIPFDENIFTD